MLASILKNNPLLLLAVIGKVLAGNKYDCYYVYPILKSIKEYREPGYGEKIKKESYCCEHDKVVKCNKQVKPPIVTELKLSKQKLKIFPKELGYLTGLEKL
jgi:hypothetical protein